MNLDLQREMHHFANCLSHGSIDSSHQRRIAAILSLWAFNMDTVLSALDQVIIEKRKSPPDENGVRDDTLQPLAAFVAGMRALS